MIFLHILNIINSIWILLIETKGKENFVLNRRQTDIKDCMKYISIVLFIKFITHNLHKYID